VIVTVGSNPTLSAYRPGAEVESQDLRHHVLVGRTSRWRGVVIAEGLRDPALINDLPVTRAFITAVGQPLDQDGGRGRWHLYWVEVSAGEIDQIQALRDTPGTRTSGGTIGCWWCTTKPGSSCRVTTGRPGSPPLITGLSKVSAVNGWIFRPTIRLGHSADTAW
jgi:hypothetical protein